MTPEPKGDAEAMCQRLEEDCLPRTSPHLRTCKSSATLRSERHEAAAFIRSLQQRNAELGRTLRMARIAAVSFRIRLSPNEIEEVDAALASVKGEMSHGEVPQGGGQ